MKIIWTNQMPLNNLTVVVNIHATYKKSHMRVFPVNRQHMISITLKVTYKNNCGLEKSWHLGKSDKDSCSVEEGQERGHLENYDYRHLANHFWISDRRPWGEFSAV